MTLEYKVGDRVRIVEGGWGISDSDVESLSGEVFEVISHLPDGYFGEDGYLLKPSLLNRFGYVPGEDGFIGGDALQLVEDLQTSNESDYLVQKISVENDVVSSAVNTSDNQLKAQDNSWYENGDLPPIGAKCIYTGVDEDFAGVIVARVAQGRDYQAIIQCEGDWWPGEAGEFRPWCSDENIAKQEREKVINKMEFVAGGDLSIAERILMERLYDAGLRFVEEGE